MKDYKFERQQINGKWFFVCINKQHFPMIEYLKDETFKIKGVDGKSRIEKDFKSAMRFAKETFKRMSKYNKNWDKDNESV